MSEILKRIDDPRDALERARRPELVRYARANGLNEITSDMPAILIRRRLRDKGLTNIKIVPQPLGQPSGAALSDATPAPADGPAVNAEADLERQFAAKPVEPQKTPAQMSINELRAECKKRGIKLTRKDGMVTMRSKIETNGE